MTFGTKVTIVPSRQNFQHPGIPGRECDVEGSAHQPSTNHTTSIIYLSPVYSEKQGCQCSPIFDGQKHWYGFLSKMLAHRSIGVILLLLLTKVLELPGQNVAALVSAKRGGGGMARSTEGAHRRGRTSLNMKLDFLRYSDNSTTLHGSAKLCSLFTHTAGHPGQLEH